MLELIAYVRHLVQGNACLEFPCFGLFSLLLLFYFFEVVHLTVIKATLNAVLYLKMEVGQCRLSIAVFSVDLRFS